MSRASRVCGWWWAGLVGLGATVPAGVAGADVIAFFDDSAFVDHGEEAARLKASVNSLGHTVNAFTGTSQGAFSSALSGADALVVPELQNGDLYAALDADTRTQVRDYVRNGGNLIISSQVGRASNLINGLFGKGVSPGGGYGTATLNAEAALGTSFEGGSATLGNFSAVQGVTVASLPSFALPIYVEGTSATVFVFPEDAGGVIYLGFDWYHLPTPGAWEAVLGRAIAYQSNVWSGSTDADWSTDANWTSNDAPDAGQRAVFAGSVNTTIQHDRAAGTEYAGLTFASNAGAFTIDGNALGLADGATVTNRSANTQTFQAGLDLHDADVTVTADTADFDFVGDITLGGGSTLALYGDADTRLAGTVGGSGALAKHGGGTLLIAADNTFSGGLDIHGGEVFLGHAGAAGSGDLALRGGTMHLGSDTEQFRTVNIGGGFTLDGGTWAVDIDNQGHSDRITADSATLTSGTVHVVPLEAISGTKTYTILNTSSGIAGDPDDLTKAISNNAYLLDYELAIVGNDLRLIASGTQSAIADLPTVQPNANRLAAARILDDAIAHSRGGTQVAALQSLSDDQLAHVVQEVQPQGHQSTTLTIRQQHRAVNASLRVRQQGMQQVVRDADVTRWSHALADAGSDLPPMGLSEESVGRHALPPSDTWTPWARSLNDWGSNDGDDLATGYDWQTHGADAGIEQLFGGHHLLGFSVAGLYNDLSGDASSGGSESTTLYTNAYYSYLQPNWHLDAGLTYGHAWTDLSRNLNALGLTAEADYESDIYGGFVGGGYIFDVDGWELEPFASLEYNHIRDKGYTETGAGGLNTTVSANGTDSLRHSLGLRIARDFVMSNKTRLRPRASAAWEHEYLDNQVAASVDLLGTSFLSRGVDVDRDTARLSVGLDWQPADNLVLYTDYTASLNEDWTSHSLNLGLRWVF